ncbi:MAG: 4-alpha-glucanotransferase [Acidobacteriaceae bacterium]|nr:4-alpha-glucanotransferase [Acidobacteriaceae bacterium]
MSKNGGSIAVPPFPSEYRSSGLLLHVTSLPSPYGIGDLGPSAFFWIDRLHDAGQCWWQSLPLGPTGYGNSPYQPMSSFAGNALLISPESLTADGLLAKNDCEAHFPSDFVDYDAVIPFKDRLLQVAWKNFKSGSRTDLRPEFEEFKNKHEHWLNDYALFRALKAKYNGAYYLDWPADVVQRRPETLANARHELIDEIDQVCFAQFLLFRQADQLKTNANSKGVRLIGDLPFFVSPDSSDVWANPELFLLDEHRRPRFVAGVPPDYFSAQGQLWGNPVYNWDALRATGYRWAIDRIRALLTHVDAIRLDHFRAFAAAWHVPAGATTAQTGQWVAGPSANFFEAVSWELGGLPFIVEDLGIITPDVRALRDQFQLPGTRVLQFAFDGHTDNPYLPHNFVSNTVVYTGTHDNAPTREWYDELPDYQRQNLWNYLNRAPGESADAVSALIGLAWSSKAALAIAPLQDVLNLGADSRMNVPGRAAGNWRWRVPQERLAASAFEWLRNLTETSKRSGASARPQQRDSGKEPMSAAVSGP